MAQSSSTQQAHLSRIIQVLGSSGAMTRADLADRARISRTTLYELAAVLLAEGTIVVAETDASRRSGRGRPAEMLTLNPDTGQFMGIAFERTRVQIVVADAGHEVIASDGAACPLETSWDDRMQVAMDLIDRMADDRSIRLPSMRGIGIGFPGPLSPSRTVRPIGDADKVRAAFEQRYDSAVLIDNSTRFAALAEASWGRDRPTADLLYLRLAGGVGGGLVIGGRLVSGTSGFAGELGHVPIPGGTILCHCGKRGCLETVASAPAVLARCDTAGVRTLVDLHTAAVAGDPVVTDVLRQTGSVIGEVLGTAAIALDPAEIVLAGDLVDAAPDLVRHVSRVIGYQLLPDLEHTPVVRASRLGEEAGALGALLAVLRRSPLLAGYPVGAIE